MIGRFVLLVISTPARVANVRSQKVCNAHTKE
jgi:hypothetical protein